MRNLCKQFWRASIDYKVEYRPVDKAGDDSAYR